MSAEVVSVASAPEKPVKKRYEWIDNARVVAAFFIMYRHWPLKLDFQGPVSAHQFEDAVAAATYDGRVPFFLILAGYFLSRNITWKKAWDRFIWLLIPFYLWNAIYYCYEQQDVLAFLHVNPLKLLGVYNIFIPQLVIAECGARTPLIVPSWFLRDILFLTLLTPILVKFKKLLFWVLLLMLVCPGLEQIEHSINMLSPETCFFYCLGILLVRFRIDDIYPLLPVKRFPVLIIAFLLGCIANAVFTRVNGSSVHTPFIAMLFGALMFAFSGVLIEKCLPRVSRYIAPWGPASFLVFMLHWPIFDIVANLLPHEVLQSYWAVLIPVPIYFFIIYLFLGMKKYTPFLMPYLGHMKVQKKKPTPAAPTAS